MSKICEMCEKKPVAGHRIVRRGLAKKKGGIGLHTTGVTPRRFYPNLRKVRVRENGRWVTRKVCMRCFRKVQSASR